MRLHLRFCLFAFAAGPMLAAEDPAWPAWKDKSIPEWDQQDAKQILADSPWVKDVKLEQVRYLSKFERRDGGNWEEGIGPTVGPEGFGFFGPSRAAVAILRARQHPDLGTVAVRWESARPIRSAELTAGEADVPAWDGDYYAVAVYSIPVPTRWNIAAELKQIAFLRAGKKKDLKPAHVRIQRHDSGLDTVVYLFPRRFEISKKERDIRFVAQIGRLFVSQFFFPAEMQFRGEPEL
jgi:hypothetical protein